jgi:hypothetical protein
MKVLNGNTKLVVSPATLCVIVDVVVPTVTLIIVCLYSKVCRNAE